MAAISRITGVEKNDAALGERFLDSSERAAARVGCVIE